MPELEERKSKVSSFFSEHASAWDRRYDPNDPEGKKVDAWEYRTRGRLSIEWLAELRDQNVGTRMLEIGCGAGVQSAAAAELGWNVTSVDFALGMLAEAKRNSTAPAWVAGVVEALPFRPHTFDVVLMNGVIGYVENPQQALRTVCELLKPGGYFIVSWASPHPLFLEAVGKVASAVPDAVYLGLKRLVTGRRNEQAAENGFYDQFLRRWRPEPFYDMLRAAKFTVQRTRSQNFGRFKFMDREVWPESLDIRVSELLDRMAGDAPHRKIRDGARTHLVMATTPRA